MRFSLYFLLFACSIYSFSCKNKTSETLSLSVPGVDSAAVKKEIEKIRKKIKADQKAIAIEEVIQRKLAQGFNGNVLVAQKGVIVYEKAFGFANFKDTIRNTL